MKNKYVVISVDDHLDQYGINYGKRVLCSFAQVDIWKSLRELLAGKEGLPDYLDKNLAVYARKKYAISNNYSVISYEEALSLMQQYEQNQYQTFLH